jgi:pyridoxal phosphate enzyme (YggS family)
VIEGGTVAQRLAAVQGAVEEAAARAGRSPEEITLIGVTKRFPAERIQEAVDAGLTHLGENRVQEAEPKIPLVRPGAGSELTWHLVGHLQKNKAQRALKLFPVIHSLDSVALAERLDRLAAEMGARPTVLVEVNLAAEPSKHGVTPEGLGALLEAIAPLEHLRLAGLMAIPPMLDPEASMKASRPYFRQLAALRDTWRSRGYDLPALSMGMTDDFPVAVEEGATHIRVGRAIFGERPPA